MVMMRSPIGKGNGEICNLKLQEHLQRELKFDLAVGTRDSEELIHRPEGGLRRNTTDGIHTAWPDVIAVAIFPVSSSRCQFRLVLVAHAIEHLLLSGP